MTTKSLTRSIDCVTYQAVTVYVARYSNDIARIITITLCNILPVFFHFTQN